jgi:hypothetical protein
VPSRNNESALQHAEPAQSLFEPLRPVAVCGRIRGARMRPASEHYGRFRKYRSRAVECKPADAHDVRRRHPLDHFPQRIVAGLIELFAGSGGQLVRRNVPAAGVHECERTIIPDEKSVEESCRSSIPGARPSPKPVSADFAAPAIESGYQAFWMLVIRTLDFSVDAKPIADHSDIAERHTALRHSERPGIHADQHDLCAASAEAFEITPVRLPCVFERVIDMGHRLADRHPRDGFAQAQGGPDEVLSRISHESKSVRTWGFANSGLRRDGQFFNNVLCLSRGKSKTMTCDERNSEPVGHTMISCSAVLDVFPQVSQGFDIPAENRAEFESDCSRRYHNMHGFIGEPGLATRQNNGHPSRRGRWRESMKSIGIRKTKGM